MNITIITDASYCPNTFVAGYGYWIACDRGKYGGGGQMITAAVINATAAEMMAVANTLHHALLQEMVQDGDHILFQTDCQSAIDAFNRARILVNEQERLVWRYFARTLLQYKLTADFRHVKGHTNRPEARFVTNNHCDRRAKQHMRAARALYYQEHPDEKLVHS